MNNQSPLYETSYVGFWIKVFSSRIEFKAGVGTQSIPINQIASIQLGMMGVWKIILETTGGKKYKIPCHKKNEVKEAIYKAQEMSNNAPNDSNFSAKEEFTPEKKQILGTDLNMNQKIMESKDVDSSAKGKPIWKKWWAWLIVIILLFSVIGMSGNEGSKNMQSVSEIAVNGRTISLGDTADSVFKTITDKYKINSSTSQEGKITNHYLDGKTLFDMTFERNKTGDYYILSKILIKDTNYQAYQQKIPPPVQYQVGYVSGFLATIVIPTGTINEKLVELLNYFHDLHKNGELSKTMKGHTVIDIFDDERWVVKENYDRIIRDRTYCDYIRAEYSIDSSGVERASIGGTDCPNYKKIAF